MKNLSHIDFEDLCRDLARAETGLRFSAFGPGPDGGIDGRHSKSGKNTILQCKHYVGSSFADLKKSSARELKSISNLKPDRYIFYTSQSLTVAKSNHLVDLFRDYIKSAEDIWGQEDIEAALRRYPDIEKSHLKLWLSSTSVLEKILSSGLEAYTEATKSEILAELRLYVRNESFDEAAKKLEEQKILIISGPPGVGKTTLAKMLSYYYLNQDWRFYAIRSLDDGFSRLDDEKSTLFFFDDFLGRIKLDRQSLLQRESAIASFIRRVRSSKNARFILTTRAHIFEEARRVSDYVDDKTLQMSKYILDVGSYTRKVKAYIFFNHLSASKLSNEHFNSLLTGDWLKKIIDHKNYNPRVIASASSETLDQIEPSEYPSYIYAALENPELIWSKPFRGLDIKCQNLVVSLFFSDEFGVSIEQLRLNFQDMHRAVCAHHAQPTLPSDFEEALRSLESGFLSISGQKVQFVNPSLRDFLKLYLTEREFLLLLPATAQRADWARELWRHIKTQFNPHPKIIRDFAIRFSAFAETITTTPSITQYHNGQFVTSNLEDIPISDRVSMLLDWWDASLKISFLSHALDTLKSKGIKVVSWRDGQALPELYWRINNYIDDDCDIKKDLLHHTTLRIIDIIDAGPAIDDLINIIESVNEYMNTEIPGVISTKINIAVDYELQETGDAIGHLDTESELNEHSENIEKLANITGHDSTLAIKVTNNRIAELEEPEVDEQEVRLSHKREIKSDYFGDTKLLSLFSNLAQR